MRARPKGNESDKNGVISLYHIRFGFYLIMRSLGGSVKNTSVLLLNQFSAETYTLYKRRIILFNVKFNI